MCALRAITRRKKKNRPAKKTSDKRTTNKQTDQKRREASWRGKQKEVGSETRCTLALNWYQRRERPESFSMAALMQTESTWTICHLYSFAIVRKVIRRMNILIIIILLDTRSLSSSLDLCWLALANRKLDRFFFFRSSVFAVYLAAANFFCWIICHFSEKTRSY